MGGLAASHQTACAFGLALLEVGEHAFLLASTDLGPLEILRVRRVTVLPAFEGRLEDLESLVVARARQQQARVDGTALSAVDAGHGHSGQHGLERSVVEHDMGRLPAEFEEHLLDRGRRALHDAAAGGSRAGEGHHVDARIGGQHFAKHVVGRGHHVEHARGQVGLLRRESRDQRG